jgi:SulP family sulfate permease
MIAFLEAKKAGLFNFHRGYFSHHFLKNILAGIIVAIIALPLSMAFAIASGVTPQEGLYTAIIAGLCISLFGGSRVQIGGPTGAFIVILAGITAKYGVEGLQIATFMAGILLLLMGILKLGSVIKYLPEPVIIGFTTGIAIIIFVGQWKYFFGLSVATQGLDFYQQIGLLLKSLRHLDPYTTGIGAGSLFILILWPKIFPKIPAPLIAMIFATMAQAIFHFQSVSTIGSTFGALPRSLPTPHFLPLSFRHFDSSLHTLSGLFLPAVAIAMLGSIESLLSAVVADSMAGTRHNSNQELIGQGIANILSPIFGGFAATGAIARTATNIRSGGTSPLAGITHAIILILMIVILAPLASNIPLSCLAAILFMVSYNMSEWRKFVLISRKMPYYDITILWVAFLLTILVNLVAAVIIGVLLACLLFMQRMSQCFETQISQTGEDLKNPENPENLSKYLKKNQFSEPPNSNNQNKKITPEYAHKNTTTKISDTKNSITFTLNGPLFFGSVSHFETLLESIQDKASHLIFDLTHVPFIDATGIIALEDLQKDCARQNIKISFMGMNPLVHQKLTRAGVITS